MKKRVLAESGLEVSVSRRQALTRALSLPLAAGLILSATPSLAQSGRTGAKVLVAYSSRTGNTRVIAGQIRRAYGADIFEIVPATPYPDDYGATVRQATRERDSEYEPPLAANVPNNAAYDTVFLGFPIWGASTPAVIRSFLAQHDLSGKTLVPFITHGGYGPGNSLGTLARLAPRARILEGLTMRADQERETLSQVTRWLGGIKVAG
jgi:flavodoxin